MDLTLLNAIKKLKATVLAGSVVQWKTNWLRFFINFKLCFCVIVLLIPCGFIREIP